MSLNDAKNAITTFKKLSKDNIKTLDLMLYFVEIGTEFTNTYGDINSQFYNSLISMYRKIIDECYRDFEIFTLYKERLKEVMDNACEIGWGYFEALSELYYSLEFTYEEEE